VSQSGRAGKEGFARSYALPHWRSRLRAVRYVGRYYGNRFGEEGPPQDSAAGLLIQALGDSNRRVRQVAAERLGFARAQMTDGEWVRDILPHLLGPMTHECKHTRWMILGKLINFARHTGVPKATVRSALPLEVICRAMAQETDIDVLWRFRYLTGHVLEAHDED